MADKYIPPATLEEAVRRRTEAVEKMQEIQAQLTERNRPGPDGQRQGNHEYHEWRGKACAALRYKTAEVRRLNVAIKEFNLAATAERVLQAGLDAKDPTSLIRAAEKLFRRLQREGVDFDGDELALISALETYRPAPAGGAGDAAA